MRIVPFPGHDDGDLEQAWLDELEAALGGAATGPDADSWRQLREDVRALAPPPGADFQRELSQLLAERAPRKRAGALSARLRRRGRPAAAAAAGLATIAAVLVALLVGVGSPHGGAPEPAPGPRVTANGGAGEASAPSARAPARSAPAARGATAGAGESASSEAAASGAPASAPGRVQQLAASLTLGVTSGQVQSAASRVARVTVDDGGYVQNSHVQVQQAGSSEASLELRLPSEKLSAALASLERVAPVREESQSLQDITGSYDAARDRLRDAESERAALLRALARAITQGQIESLHARLAQADGAIARAHAAFEAVSRRAGTAEVEVTVIGGAHASSEGLTLRHGLHDAGRVLVVALIVLLIAAAVLLPATLMLLALAAAMRAWRRCRREHALDAA